MTRQELVRTLQKLLDTFVKPKFPEIWEIKVSENWLKFEIDILVEGTDQEQEEEIEDEVQNIILYTGERFVYGITFHVEDYRKEEET
jgi:hypothetical protein